MSLNALSDREWLASKFDALTDEAVMLSPSEFAEQVRVLPAGSSSMPGPFRFAVTPYLKEILDCLGVDSPIRFIAFMKGVQIAFTSGVLENALLYEIAHIKTSPCMLVTADAELAQLRLDGNIIPMVHASGISDLIQSNDEKNPRKTGQTSKKVSWIGGGFLIPFGAQNANKLRSIPIQCLYMDEVDGWPLQVGRDGDPIALAIDRTAAFEDSRKILMGSTPTIKGLSKIEANFLLGDQRYYFVCCVKCGEAQTLRWQRVDEEGVLSGMTWKMDGDRLVPGSVRYVCQNSDCGHAHTNDDKTRLLAPENGAEWRPTAKPSAPHIRSYHLSALYSPIGMQSWEACVLKWLEAWDVEHKRPKDMGKFQAFYNNVLGESFQLQGHKLTFSRVSSHRRQEYQRGEIPNQLAATFCGSPILLLTCAVDVHKDNLAVLVSGWTRGGRHFVIDYDRFEGNTEDLDDEPTWGRLRRLIEEKIYIADDGQRYAVQLTLIDSGYRADDVYRFCSEYSLGVFPIKGRTTSSEFSIFKTTLGTTGFNVNVDHYKDRWSASLNRNWSGQDQQPEWHFNAPINLSDKALKELTAESKTEQVDPKTGQRRPSIWKRSSDNELWDVLIYNAAALEMIAANVCTNQFGLEAVNWTRFWDQIAETKTYTLDAA